MAEIERGISGRVVVQTNGEPQVIEVDPADDLALSIGRGEVHPGAARGVGREGGAVSPRYCACGCQTPLPAEARPNQLYVSQQHKKRAQWARYAPKAKQKRRRP